MIYNKCKCNHVFKPGSHDASFDDNNCLSVDTWRKKLCVKLDTSFSQRNEHWRENIYFK